MRQRFVYAYSIIRTQLQSPSPLTMLKSRPQKKINVLGVIFDQKLQWSDHVAHCISESNKALCAIRLISKFFNTTELLQLITSNFYSILYYNSEIWHLPTLKGILKQKLLSSSARAIKVCVKFNVNDVSFARIHEIYKRSTPENYLLYKQAWHFTNCFGVMTFQRSLYILIFSCLCSEV